MAISLPDVQPVLNKHFARRKGKYSKQAVTDALVIYNETKHKNTLRGGDNK